MHARTAKICLILASVTLSCCTKPPVQTPTGRQISVARATHIGDLQPDAAIIFSSQRWRPQRRSFGNWEVFVMNERGENAERMTYAEYSQEHAFVSPDHRFIATSRAQKEPQEQRELWVLDLQNKTEAQLVPDFYTAANGGFSWSRDGFIYFVGRPHKRDGTDIYRIRPDGTELTQITHTPEDEYDVSVSSDGEWLVFVRLVPRPPHRQAQIWLMRADGSNERMLYDGGPRLGADPAGFPFGSFDPCFSPDRTRVVFSRSNPDFDNFRHGAQDICVINVDGTGFRVISPKVGALQVIPSWVDDKILYTEINEKERYLGLVTIHPDGTGWQRLESGLKNWTDGGRNGRWIPRLDPQWPYRSVRPAAGAAATAPPAAAKAP